MKKVSKLSLMLSAATIFACPAYAQDYNESLFKRDRNVSVEERPKPGYDALGIRSGSFLIFPALTIQPEINDNIFAVDTNEESDVIVNVRPSVEIQSNFSRHQLRFNADVAHHEYADFGNESTTDFGVGSEGRIDIRRGMFINGGANYRQLHEGRSAAGLANGTLDPIQYSATNLFVRGVREGGRAKIEASVGFDNLDYDDATLVGGAIADQDFRDRNVLELGLRGDYAISSDTSVFARIRYQDQTHDSVPITIIAPDQNGFNAVIGADFDLTNLVRGEVGVGYLQRSFDSPQIADVDGFSYNGSVEWFASPLITVEAYGSRTVNASGLIVSPAFVDTNFGINADYELRRNIILSTGYDFSRESYQGIDRIDKRNRVFASGTYLMNRNLGVSVNLIRSTLNSEGVLNQTDFGATQLLFGVTLRR